MMNNEQKSGPIGVFDSGYGGLTILDEIRKVLPQYDYLYLGDNARTPYGTRSFEVVYEFTREAVQKLFSMGCSLVILACNTASAKALRTIQQNDLPIWGEELRTLGVIRPTVEAVNQWSKSHKIGVLGTEGTVQSQSYTLELNKLYPEIEVFQQACPMWVPLVENNEYNSIGADYFVQKNISDLLNQNKDIDTVILGCTHYPLLEEKIKKFLPPHVQILKQGPLVAHSLKDYLTRHPEMERLCSKGAQCTYMTTEQAERFSKTASIFLNQNIQAENISLDL